MRTITLETLVSLNACDDQVELFRKLFGKKRSFRSEASCVKVAVKHATQFDWDWAARRLLSDTAWVEYDKATAAARAKWKKAIAPARDEYDKAIAPALADYRKATAAARDKRNKATAAAWADYRKATAAARAERNKAIAPALADYRKATAPAFARLWFNDKEAG